MESANRVTENALFYGVDSTSYARADISGYPDDLQVTNPNDSVARVNGNGPTVGPAIILKVMSGDKIDLAVQYYYNSNSITSGPPLSAQSLLNSLASGLGALSGPAEASMAALSNPSSSPLLAALSSSISNESGGDPAKPQAFLNWVLLDDQFNYVGGNNQSGALQVGSAGTQSNGALQTPLCFKGLPITKSGYLYIYVSNATKGWDVFFDNLNVKHYSGPLVEENHYYPFGLLMSGISDKAVKTNYAENKYRFNGGNELQSKEFSDGTGLEMYDATHRMYDPQIGRFSRIDDMAELAYPYSPYAFVLDNPISFYDPLGDSATLPTVTVTAAKPGSLTYGLNHYNFAQVDAWVDGMLHKGHSSSQIDRWALSNDLLNADTRKWILAGTTDDSKRYRHRMASSWRAQGKVYKALLAAYAARLGFEGVQVFLKDNPVTYDNAADLLDDANFDDKQLKHGEYHGEMDGDADEIQTDVARGATKTGEGQYKLPDSTDVKFYKSNTNGQSMQVNTGDVIYKIRIK